MILSLSDAATLKQEAAERFGVSIHFHDGCGGQYFSVDEPTQEFKAYITAFFAQRNLLVHFFADGEQFIVEEMSSC